MSKQLLFLICFVTMGSSTFAQNREVQSMSPQAERENRIINDGETKIKTYKTVGEFLKAIRPKIGEKWANVLSEKAKEQNAQSYGVQTHENHEFVFKIGTEAISFQLISLNDAKYLINHKSYTFDPKKSPNQTWNDVMALMPQTNASRRPLQLLPEADASPLILAGAAVALGVGLYKYWDVQVVDGNCDKQRDLFKPLCFNRDNEMAFHNAAESYFKIDGDRLDICSTKDENRKCLIKAMKSGRLKTSEMTDSGMRAFYQNLGGTPAVPAGNLGSEPESRH